MSFPRGWLGTPEATRTINALWPEEVHARDMAESTDAIVTRHIQHWFAQTATRYGIQRTTDGFWWAGSHDWSVRASPARWFDSMGAAEMAALIELPDPRDTWTARPIPDEAL